MRIPCIDTIKTVIRFATIITVMPTNMNFIYLLILISSTHSLVCMRATPIRPRKIAHASTAMRLAGRAISQRNKMHHTQHDLARTLSIIAPRKLKPEHIQPIIDALVHENGMPPICAHKDFLEYAIRTFAHTPGFFPTIHHLLIHAKTDHHSFKGTLHELQQALKIALSTKEKVLGINQKVSCAENIIVKEFDICTTAGFVECKNIQWPTSPGYSHHLRTQFEQQNAIVTSLNAQREHEFYFEVRSKERIPNAWCQWFEDHGITFSW